MRHLCPLVLVAGCAIDARPPDEPAPTLEGPGMLDDLDGTPTRLVPAVCDQRTWTPTVDAKDASLAAVGTPTGATFFHVASTGGPVRGFQVDGRGDVIGDPRGTVVRDDRAYTRVTAGQASGRLVLAAVTDDKVAIDLVRDDLGAVHPLGDVEGTLAGHVPVVPVRDGRIAVVGGPGGLAATGFAGGMWDEIGTVTLAKGGVVSMTATPYLDDAMIAWSTDSKECHLQRFASRKESVRAFGCDDARIAIDPASGRGMLAYTLGGKVVRTQIRVGGESELADELPVADFATSPRTAFDGRRIWISYLDAHGDVVVGFVDERGELISRALEGTRPEVDAYELVVFDGAPWVVAIDDGAFTAQRMCARPQ